MPNAVSFRDPSGYVEISKDRVVRHVEPSHAPFVEELLHDPLILKWMNEGSLSSIKHLETTSDKGLTIEHEMIPFPSYPYEWPSEMLHAAGDLTLKMAKELHRKGWGFKDATPYNVLFRGPDPVFVDWLSIEQRESCDPLWLPSAQFMRTFIYPLLAQTKLGISLNSIFLSRRDGLECEEIFRMCKGWRIFTPQFFSLVALPTWLSKSKDEGKVYRTVRLGSPEKAGFVFEMHLRRLQRTLEKLKPSSEHKSRWGDYLIGETSYTEDQFKAKENKVSSILKKYQPRSILDIGCNAGHFTMMAAEKAEQVVAIDADPVVVGRLWRQARQKKLPILPLIVNIARPSPALGWEYQEHLSFIERAEGKFDCVIMLAVLHHLLVQERVPMDKLAKMVHRLTTRGLLIEFVGREDAMFKRIARGRDALHVEVTPERFEEVFESYFTIKSKERIHDAHRYLYYMERK